MSLILSVPLVLSFVLSSLPAQAAAPMTTDRTMPQVQTVKEYVQSYFSDTPILVAISECESHFHQYNSDGSVYRGTINNQDIGVMQINTHYQADTAKALGLDIYTLQGNVAYAQYLYNKEGVTPWDSSYQCWDKSEAAKNLKLADAIK